MTDATGPTVPTVGMPATIHLRNDSLPAVVVRVNQKSVTVARVAHREDTRHRINDEREPLPCYAWEADLAQVIGEPERYPMVRPGRYRNGSIGLTLGKAVRITDYRE